MIPAVGTHRLPGLLRTSYLRILQGPAGRPTACCSGTLDNVPSKGQIFRSTQLINLKFQALLIPPQRRRPCPCKPARIKTAAPLVRRQRKSLDRDTASRRSLPCFDRSVLCIFQPFQPFQPGSIFTRRILRLIFRRSDGSVGSPTSSSSGAPRENPSSLLADPSALTHLRRRGASERNSPQGPYNMFTLLAPRRGVACSLRISQATETYRKLRDFILCARGLLLFSFQLRSNLTESHSPPWCCDSKTDDRKSPPA